MFSSPPPPRSFRFGVRKMKSKGFYFSQSKQDEGGWLGSFTALLKIAT